MAFKKLVPKMVYIAVQKHTLDSLFFFNSVVDWVNISKKSYS